MGYVPPPDPRDANPAMNRCEPPWFLIARGALRGISLETLSVRYHVSIEDIQRHLDRAISVDPTGVVRVRNNAEISQASSRVRNDLVSILIEAVDELHCSQLPRLSQLLEFEKLLEAASKLFQWPRMTVSRIMASGPGATAYGMTMNEAGQPTGAVNLALIATSPEQLAMLAKKQENFGNDNQTKSEEAPITNQRDPLP